MGTRAIWPLSWQRPLFPKIRYLPCDKGRDFEDPLAPSRIRTDGAFDLACVVAMVGLQDG